jgi:hypothetical protein
MELRRTSKNTSSNKTNSSNTPTNGLGKSSRKTIVSAEQRYRMICEAAYYVAQKRGFKGGNPVEDWVKAEHQIDTMLSRIDDLMGR